MEELLLQEFPSTEAGSWYVKSGGGKNPRGKLYDAYNDWKVKLRNSNLRTAEKRAPYKKPSSEVEKTVNTKAETQSLERLKELVDVENIRQMKIDWDLTFASRRQELVKCENPKDIFDKYPVYKSKIGRDLVKTVLFTIFDQSYSFLYFYLDNF